MMKRGHSYSWSPMVADKRATKRRKLDMLLMNTLSLLIGFAGGVVIMTYFPLPWNL